MRKPGISVLAGVGGILLLAAVTVGSIDEQSQPHDATRFSQQALAARSAAVSEFLTSHQGTHIRDTERGISRVYGKAFSTGADPIQSAEAFRQQHAAMFGIAAEELAPIGRFATGDHVVPIMYDRETDTYKFTGVYYTQYKFGLPVYGGEMMTLVRNEPGFPAVLVSSNIRDVSVLTEQANAAVLANPTQAFDQAKLAVGADMVFSEPQPVIWAGIDDMLVQPRVAFVFEAERHTPFDADYERMKYVADAATGQILHQENLIHDVDVTGTVSARATDGPGADICDPLALTPMPYARVTIGSTEAFADVDGNFIIPNPGVTSVTVGASVRGQYFRVFNEIGSEAQLSQTLLPPGPVNFEFNQSETEERTGEVNTYIHANVVRDFILDINPDYPVIGGQEEFTILANDTGGICPGNAQYFGDGMRFCFSGGSAPNTGFSSIVYHEYGHHLVATGGSGQGQYGEGMSDCISVILLDDPNVGIGFFGSCGGPLRTADNNTQYPCNGAIHTCGQVISGCVWDTRQELFQSDPFSYLDILRPLVVNSILLHTGSNIDPSITIDFLTLDDDDADLTNGTPHYDEIAAGFAQHNMDAPELAPFFYTYPLGQPELVSPEGGTQIRVNVQGNGENPDFNSAQFFVDTGSGFTEVNLLQLTSTLYRGFFPVSECGTEIRYYFSADFDGGAGSFADPPGAPAVYFTTVSGLELEVPFEDDFEADLGWTVTNTPGLTNGAWERAIPVNDAPGPTVDADGSGHCYVTGNAFGDSDVDGGSTTLTSPQMDASNPGAILEYYTWLDNDIGLDPMFIEVSDDNGQSWIDLEQIGPIGQNGGWEKSQFAIGDIAGLTPNDQFRVRFTIGDNFASVTVEAGVDGIELSAPVCEEEMFDPEDVNEDGNVDVFDILDVLSEWGACSMPCPPECAEDANEDCSVDVFDILAILGAWSS